MVRSSTVEAYDEFGFFEELAAELGRHGAEPPTVTRTELDVGGGRKLSALLWDEGSPRLVLLHGGAQHAHTWDGVALALEEPLVALDLPGHGRSSWREDGDYSPHTLTEDVASAVHQLAPDAGSVVGMSLGGLVAVALADRHPDLVRSLVLVEALPGAKPNSDRTANDLAITQGLDRFPSFDALLEHSTRFIPNRPRASLKRGVLHNAKQNPDDTWSWRYDPRLVQKASREASMKGLAVLRGSLERSEIPLHLVLGGNSGFVTESDLSELRRLRPEVRVSVVEGAGHSVQGSRPLELASIISEDFRGVVEHPRT